MKLVIFGSRTLSPSTSDIDIVVDMVLSHLEPDEVISGMATGVDSAAIRYAKHYMYPVLEMPADWSKHGRVAGLLRNEEMCKLADAWVCFWDGESTGTKDMLKRVMRKGIPGCLVYKGRV